MLGHVAARAVLDVDETHREVVIRAQLERGRAPNAAHAPDA